MLNYVLTNEEALPSIKAAGLEIRRSKLPKGACKYTAKCFPSLPPVGIVLPANLK